MMGDHSESIQIDYDPGAISYETLLGIFWNSHDPALPSWSRQYMSAIFYHDEEQRKAAERTLKAEEDRRGRKIHTEIRPAGMFHMAEHYHQKYRLRSSAVIMEEFLAVYPDPDGFTASTAAARVNGYLGGNGTVSQLESELDSLGLSPRGRKQLLEIVTASVSQ